MGFREEAGLLRRDGGPRGDEFGGVVPLTLAQQFAALFLSGDSWFDADYTSVDGVSGLTSGIIDYIDPTHVLTQSTGAKQCALAATDAAFASAKSLVFTGAQTYASNRAPSAWRYGSNGTGSTFYYVYSPHAFTTAQFFGTRDATAGVGFNLYGSGPAGYAITNGGVVANGTSTSVADTAYAVQLRFNTGNTPNWQYLRNGVSQASGSNGGAPSAADPVGSLTLGSYAGGAAGFASQRFRALYCFQRLLSTNEQAIAAAWILSQTGLTA